METPQQPAVPEHSTGQVPTPRTPPAGGPPPPMFPVVPAGKRGRGMVPRSRRARLAIAVIGGVLALLCVGGIGITFVLYDDATKIDRGSPDVAVDNFLRAYLVNRNDAEAALYTCKAQVDLLEINAFRSDIQDREKQYSIKILVSWTELNVAAAGGEASVSTDIRRAIADGSERLSERWEFDVVDEGGWRVCSASKVG